jgi:hypothetical protein
MRIKIIRKLGSTFWHATDVDQQRTRSQLGCASGVDHLLQTEGALAWLRRRVLAGCWPSVLNTASSGSEFAFIITSTDILSSN